MLFVPPEGFQIGHKNKIEKIEKQDVWALGVIAYYLCKFEFPFADI